MRGSHGHVPSLKPNRSEREMLFVRASRGKNADGIGESEGTVKIFSITKSFGSHKKKKMEKAAPVLTGRRLSALLDAERKSPRYPRQAAGYGSDYFLWQVESPGQLLSPVLRFGQSVQSPKPSVAPPVGLELL